MFMPKLRHVFRRLGGICKSLKMKDNLEKFVSAARAVLKQNGESVPERRAGVA
jgi:hypothetical protein